MSEDDALALVTSIESGEKIPEGRSNDIMIALLLLERKDKRAWRRGVKWAAPILTVVLGGGGFTIVRTAPDPAPVVVQAPVEVVALSVEERLDVVEPRVDANDGALRHLEELVVDGIEWAGTAMSRKRGQAVPTFPDSMRDARGDMTDRRKAERDARARLEYDRRNP